VTVVDVTGGLANFGQRMKLSLTVTAWGNDQLHALAVEGLLNATASESGRLQMSPAGTAELSPRSPGLACAMDKSRRDDWKSIETCPGSGKRMGDSSRPYGTCLLSNLYPGLRPGLSSAVPTGLDNHDSRRG
jgi:hypothetical protein